MDRVSDEPDAAARLPASSAPVPARCAAKHAIDRPGLDLDAGLAIERVHFSALFAPRTRR